VRVTDPAAPPVTMRVRKRNGDFEAVNVDKIVRAVSRCATGLTEVDPMRVATRTISGLYNGATTAELDRLSIQTAAELVAEEPAYSKLAAALLATYIDKEVRGQGAHSFSQSIALGHAQGLIGEAIAAFVAAHARKLDDAIDTSADQHRSLFSGHTIAERIMGQNLIRPFSIPPFCASSARRAGLGGDGQYRTTPTAESG